MIFHKLSKDESKALGFLMGFTFEASARKGPEFHAIARRNIEELIPLLRTDAERLVLRAILKGMDPLEALSRIAAGEYGL